MPLAASLGSPLDQLNSGTPATMIQCSGELVLVQSSTGKPLCITDETSKVLADRANKTNASLLDTVGVTNDTLIQSKIDSTTPAFLYANVTDPATITITLDKNITSDNNLSPADFTLTGIKKFNESIDVSVGSVSILNNTITLTISDGAVRHFDNPLISYIPNTDNLTDTSNSTLLGIYRSRGNAH